MHTLAIVLVVAFSMEILYTIKSIGLPVHAQKSTNAYINGLQLLAGLVGVLIWGTGVLKWILTGYFGFTLLLVVVFISAMLDGTMNIKTLQPKILTWGAVNVGLVIDAILLLLVCLLWL